VLNIGSQTSGSGAGKVALLGFAGAVILVYLRELMPGEVGMVSGHFFGFASGMGGPGAAVLAAVARSGRSAVGRSGS
jgi:hypothetical protein